MGIPRLASVLADVVATCRTTFQSWVERASFTAGAIWLAVYATLLATGERFDDGGLHESWQLIPWEILSNDPIRSVFYLHTQPPLWNLMLGLAGWTSPLSDSITMQTMMMLLGVSTAVCATLLAQRLGLRRRHAIVAALLATLHPEVLRHAFSPNYELAVAALLLGLLLASTYVGAANGTHYAIVLVACLSTATTLTRSLYHPLWLVLILLACWWSARSEIDRRTVLAAATIPLVLLGGWIVKNELLYETSMSSWTGMNLQRSIVPIADREDLAEMERTGEVSAIVDIGPFSPYQSYRPFMPPCEPRYGHPAVARPTAISGTSNFNYECYLPVYAQAGRDALAVIRSRPDLFLRGRLWSLRQTFAVDNSPQYAGSVIMRGLDSVFSLGRLDVHLGTDTDGWGDRDFARVISPSRYGLVPIAGYMAVVVLGARRLRRFGSTGDQDLCLVLGALTIVWTIAVGAIAELGEQARFRTMVDPLVWVLCASAVLPRVAAIRPRIAGMRRRYD